MTTWEITAPCHCHDPYVFGHIICAGETQPWTQPPLLTYGAGETFTIIPETVIMNYTETIMSCTEAAARISRASHEISRHLPNATTTPWNWVEPSQTHPLRVELWGTSGPCA